MVLSRRGHSKKRWSSSWSKNIYIC